MSRSESDILKKSLIQTTQQMPFYLRCLQVIDIFSFIPVPKTAAVSTKCSLIGSFFFFLIFLSYIIYDLVGFIKSNPPIPNSFYADIDEANYSLPHFCITYMEGENLDNPLDTTANFKFDVKVNEKSRRKTVEDPLKFADSNNLNWIDDETRNFYSTLKCSNQTNRLNASGLLYSTPVAINPVIKISECVNSSSNPITCNSTEGIKSLESGGRVFLFIQKMKSKYDQISDGANFLLYNFFLVRGTYNRISVLLQVNRQIYLPDYLNTFREETVEKLEVLFISELNSDVTIYSPDKLLSIEFTLAPNIKVTRVAYSTLIDHISQWGALWGVEFAIFALLFLAYNRRKFYQKNPEWDRFDQVNVNAQGQSLMSEDSRKDS